MANGDLADAAVVTAALFSTDQPGSEWEGRAVQRPKGGRVRAGAHASFAGGDVPFTRKKINRLVYMSGLPYTLLLSPIKFHSHNSLNPHPERPVVFPGQ